jgi:hypothetical protein
LIWLNPMVCAAMHAAAMQAFTGRLKWWLAAVCAVVMAVASAHAAETLKPGEFRWTPDIAPSGPLAIVISLPEQRAYVYRNGMRIGLSTVSTGRDGFETPSGIYTILQKDREHYSNRYDNAPMPFMQRLTWDGVALHAGSLPGYPASHGCIRLPTAFAEKLFEVTTPGTLVVVASHAYPPQVVSPGLFSPVDSATGQARITVKEVSTEWAPEQAPPGPVSILLSTSDQQLLVFRNGVEIGRAPVEAKDLPPIGTVAFVMLEGTLDEPSPVLPDRPALRWLALPSSHGASRDALREALLSGRLRLPQAFVSELRELLQPGATVILTDEALEPAMRAVEPGQTAEP